MVLTDQITPGMTISIKKKIYRIESCFNVKVEKGTDFIKAKLRDLRTDKVIEKNFKLNQEIEEVTLSEKNLEFLYPEGNEYFFLDIDSLEQEVIPLSVLLDKINYLKEGILVKAKFYGSSVFTIELPAFLELMVVKTQSVSNKVNVSNSTKKAVLETGAEINVPLFVEVGDIVKIDTNRNEYIQRV